MRAIILGFSLLFAGAFKALAQSEYETETDPEGIKDLMAWIDGSWISVRQTPDGLKQYHPSCETGYTFEVWPGGLEKGWDNPRIFDVVSIRYESSNEEPDFLEVTYHDPMMNQTGSFTVRRYPSVSWWLIDGESHFVLSADLDHLAVSEIECEEEEH